MIVAAIISVAVAVALVYVAKPLFAPRTAEVDRDLGDAAVRKLRALQAILELEDELAAGKISGDDFMTYKEMYEQEALLAMRELDVAARTFNDESLEAEIAAARAELR